MYLSARNCAPAMSAATRMVSQRGAPSAMGSLGHSGLNGWTKGSVASSGHIRSFSRRCLGSSHRPRAPVLPPTTRLSCAVPAALSAKHFGCQIRGFSQADHTQVSGDNPKTEELLEKFEVQEGNQEARPQHTILHEDKKEKKSPLEGNNWPERMTKGNFFHDDFQPHSLITLGKMLTTPSRLFKLIVPLTTIGNQGRDKGKHASDIPRA